MCSFLGHFDDEPKCWSTDPNLTGVHSIFQRAVSINYAELMAMIQRTLEILNEQEACSNKEIAEKFMLSSASNRIL